VISSMRALSDAELARRRAGQEADQLRSGFEVTPYVSTVPSGVRLADADAPQSRTKADPGCDCDR